MEQKNKFYIAKEQTVSVVPGYTYNATTGERQVGESGDIVINAHPTNGAKRIIIDDITFSHNTFYMYKWNSSNVYIGIEEVNIINSCIDVSITGDVKTVAFGSSNSDLTSSITKIEKYGFLINPHYKQIKKVYKKESNQMFFRESLEGTISLFNVDYDIVNNASIEDIMHFYVYQNGIKYASASFNKSDCKIDRFKLKVELKLSYDDKYTKILNAYENTYDLIKLAPALTPLTLTKRCVVQIYVQGENVLSNYAGGTYWETDVNESVDDTEELTRKYHFAKGPKYLEVDLQGFNYDINAAYRGLSNNSIWNATSKKEVNGQIYKIPCSIKFTKVHSADEYAGAVNPGNVKMLSTGSGDGTYQIGDDEFYYRYDTYTIEIYTGRDGSGTKIYQSNYQYGKNTDFTLAVGEGLYPMSKIEQPVPQMDPTPNTFNLGEYVIEYQIWGRLLCDVDSIPDGEGGTIETYDLPRDDFATPRRNYRKCIGLIGFDRDDSVVQIFQTENVSEEPTAYGINDFGEYFIPPYTYYGQYFYPLARSSWANVSMWVRLGFINNITLFEASCQKYYKEYTIKDVYHIGDAIKALLAEIDPSILHEKTSEYSSFLYGHSGGTASILGNCDVYITQKTNILKGEYDQAAQKAEIKFKQLMDMLRDCFRCYWFIDSQNRFRIEHISYFLKGLSYNTPIIQLDLTGKTDKFNRKQALYCQQELEFDKSDLTSRYEFSWMDDTTKAMGGDLYVNVNNTYIKKDKTDEIRVDMFTADIDYMLFLPDDFSNEGFAIMLADDSRKVPIVNSYIRDEKQYNREINVFVQNMYASFNQLIWHYMEDIPGNILSYNNIGHLYPGHIKKSMKHDISFPSEGLSLNLYGLVTTEVGDGYIEAMDVNIDTNMVDMELRYEPE